MFKKLRALARVVRAAAAWAEAERELRDTSRAQDAGVFIDEEAKDRVYTACDYTENELLAAVEEAQAIGLNLARFSALS